MSDIDAWRVDRINEIVKKFLARNHYSEEETARWAMFAMGQVSMVMALHDEIVRERIDRERLEA